MKFSPKLAVPAVVLACGAFALRAGLTEWAENIDAASRLESVFFRSVTVSGTRVPLRRPPSETRPELTRMITAAPNDAELYSLRALEDEQQLDFAAAEADWKKYVDVAMDPGAARLALADYYHRRHQPQQEFEALTFAAREFAPASERLLPETQQRPWKTYQRLMQLIDDQRLDAALGVPQFNAWIQRFPREPAAYSASFDWALAHNFNAEADQVVAAYQAAFPADAEFPVAARAQIAAHAGQTADAIAIYERSYQPLWPASLVKRYFDLLKQTTGLRAYLERARAGVVQNPTDLAAATRVYHYWNQQGNTAAAGRALVEFRQRKQAAQSAFTAPELLALARLSEASRDYDEAARSYYALYVSSPAQSEAALAGLANLLLTAPEQPIHFGSGNFNFYRDAATIDPQPGFLNAVLSLVLNDTDLAGKHADQERNAVPYFHRAEAAELVNLFDTRFPNSPARAGLWEALIGAYAVYGDNASVIRAGTRFLTDFPDADNRTAVALRLADAYARTNQTAQEFALYQTMLTELARKADGVPLGSAPPTPAQPGQQSASPTVRSADYARVLARYVARLVALRRTNDALALFRREIDQNPNDPGLYDLLAAFLDQNQLGAQIEQVYQRAIAQFPDPTWRHKLARWYLRQRRAADINRLTREVTAIFSGTDLEAYFREIVTPGAPIGPAAYVQLNLAAHTRFPHQLSFVRNLLDAYATRATANDVAYEALLRQHWIYASDLRQRFFERLSRTGRLSAELTAVRATNPTATQNPAAVRLLADGEIWRGHYETAAPLERAIVAAYPADRDRGESAAALLRSLGSADQAAAVEAQLSQADPLDHAALTRAGEIQADRGRFDLARASWDRIPLIEPAKPDGYLETATIYWDYYRYDDALRWIETARTRLNQPALYAYQAGVIHENQRDYDGAMREYARGALGQPAGGSSAERRLLALARRATFRQPIEQLTDNLASARNPDAGAFQLRIALLESQNRRDDLEKFLSDITARADSADTLDAVRNTSRSRGFPRVEQAAIERRIAQATDPVEKMSLRLTLARFDEAQAQTAEGAQVIDALYRENPAVLGVVRAAVDYHWRNANRRRAVDVLEEAARRAQAPYRTQFTLEAARKATESADYARARGFATTLLAADPFNAEFIAALADTYAREGDDAGLRTFYSTKIADLARAPLDAADRIERTAALRRALIPVLARTRDYAGAADQYIEILNRFPEDDALAREAAQFARTNNVAPRLRDYYVKAVADSPKDVRWALVLGRIQTVLEDYPAAIDAFTRASAVRPDRPDLLEARLNLEERLLRFDDAGTTASKLYDLTYHNPLWIEKLAEIRARQGRTADAVTALTTAWIDGRSPDPSNYFSAAQKLESWGMLAEARKMIEDGLRRVPAGETSQPGEIAFARIATRLRDTSAVFTRMAALPAAEQRSVAAQMGAAVAAYFTPDEKAAFATTIATQPRRTEIATAAGLAPQQAAWLFATMTGAPNSNAARQAKEQLVPLQMQRAQFAELARQLEAYDAALLPARRTNELEEAANSFRAAADPVGELRVLTRASQRAPLSPLLLERYARLLMTQPTRLNPALAAETRGDIAYRILNVIVEQGTPAVAQQAIAARAVREGALWGRGYTALAGLYYGNAAPGVRTAFTGLLGDMTIGSRIGKPVDRTTQLAGDLWFYYGGRFGEYLASTRQPDAADFLPAMIEAAPEHADAYFALGEYYSESGDAAAAAEEFGHALELDPDRADVHDRLAQLAARAGNQADAIAQWKLAFQQFTAQMNASRLPPNFWSSVNLTLTHIAAARLQDPLRADADALLRLYVRRNGAFQIDPLFQGAMTFAGTPDAGVQWIADLARASSDPAQLLRMLLDRDYIPDAQRDLLHRQAVDALRARTAQLFGDARTDADYQLASAEITYAEYLVTHRDNPRARAELDQVPAEIRKQRQQQILPLELILAARANTLDAALSQIAEPLPVDALRSAAQTLRDTGAPAPSRQVLEFLYRHELNAGRLDASNFLGLAELRLEANDAPAALALLRRMTLVSNGGFATFDQAAGLLERSQRPADAVEFLTALTKAEPWNAAARVRLAAPTDLTQIARSAAAPYATRVDAARALRRLQAPVLTGVDSELDRLSSSAPAPVTNAYSYEARLDAAAAAGLSAAQREDQLRAAVAIQPAPAGPRVRLFQAALAAGHDSLAIAVASQLLPDYSRGGFARPIDVSQGFPQLTGLPEGANFLPQLATADRAPLAAGLGEAYRRAGDLNLAQQYLTLAQEIAPTAAATQSLNAVRAAIRQRATNNARRPMVAKNLDQDHPVRPRVAQ